MSDGWFCAISWKNETDWKPEYLCLGYHIHLWEQNKQGWLNLEKHGYENIREAAFMFCAHLDIEALAKKVEVKYIFCLWTICS